MRASIIIQRVDDDIIIYAYYYMNTNKPLLPRSMILLCIFKLFFTTGLFIVVVESFSDFPIIRRRHGAAASINKGEKLLTAAASSSLSNNDEYGHQESITSLSKKLELILHTSPNSDDKSEIQKELLITRLPNLFLNRTHVGASKIRNAGKGLFANCDCPRGTLLTCYPGDALVAFNVDDDDDEYQVFWGKHVKLHDVNHKNGYNESLLDPQYMLRAVSDEWGIVALPFIVDDCAAYFGHFANDGASNPPTCEAELSLYVLESNSKANAIHQPLKDCHMVTVATRNITKGEEIFVTYGPDYWMEQSSFRATKDYANKEDESTPFDSTGKGFG